MGKAKIAEAIRKPKPTILLSEDDLKALKYAKVDDEMVLEVKVKIKSLSRDEWNNNLLTARAEIQKISKKNTYQEDYAEAMSKSRR